VIDLIRIAFFGYAIKLVWVYIRIIGDESMTTINLPKDYVYYSVLLGFVLMFVRFRAGSVATLAAGLFDPRTSRCLRRF